MNTEIAEKIRVYRKLKGLTQEELANKSGISLMSIRRYEKGERIANEQSLKKIAAALGIHDYELMPDWPEPFEGEELSYIYEMAQMYFASKKLDAFLSKEILSRFSSLNTFGKLAAIEEINELTKNKKYVCEDHDKIE